MKKLFPGILERRFQKNNAKMKALAEQTAQGTVGSFAGMFQVKELTAEEKNVLIELLRQYGEMDPDEVDIGILSRLTAEVRMIHHQSIILHGERIQKARDLLKKYKEGAFSSWLMMAYGNRQTPYNFLLYYEFYTILPLALRDIAEKMPRQAMYALAARKGDPEEKMALLRNYSGEKKQVILASIRALFPLADQDRRQHRPSAQIMKGLKQILEMMNVSDFSLNSSEALDMIQVLEEMKERIEPLLVKAMRS
ncbi:Virulence plasmid protein pGP6-D-related protein [Candidatus Clavichlamydia salmonicola]|uniref:CT583 family protein n=1 Tax=Candidatus Clavichlamydia salmonicola TaxID=469812 RepID=UPI0018911E81|nr:CT583 family protein [Candidatus Clavichlamydia salmonicola]MBF5050583.1 Virulence plasmid protein pGP6-D-related protein [Candidatus Clavichlamydia salmonicola]